jgi:putative membrane protein
MKTFLYFTVTALIAGASPTLAKTGPTDPQIAHIAYTADNIDIAAARLALSHTQTKAVRAFAQEMIRDHEAVNTKALALVKELHVTPEANATSTSLSESAAATTKRLSKLRDAAFDRAYADNEVKYHQAVNDALEKTLIPSAKNAQLKDLLQTGLTLFREHQMHAEHLAAALK